MLDFTLIVIDIIMLCTFFTISNRICAIREDVKIITKNSYKKDDINKN